MAEENSTVQPASTPNPYVSAGISTATGLVNNILGEWRASRQRKWSEKQTEQQREWDLMMWNKTNEYNDPANKMARLHNAGINPMDVGLDGSSTASTIQASTPLGYQRVGDTVGLTNPMDAFNQQALGNKQIEVMNKEIDNLQSQIDNRNEQTKGLILDNEWKERTLNARVEGQNLANNLTKEQINQVKENTEKVRKDIEKTIQETKSEIARQGLIEAQKWLAKANEKQITELIPFQKNLMEAQTEAQKAASAASWANVAYQMELISNGYIEKMCAELEARTKSAEAVSALNAFKASVKNGNIFTITDKDWWGSEWGKKALNSLFYDINVIAETLTGGLSGVFK